MRRFKQVLIASAVVALASVSSAENGMREGKWETTMEVKMEGMPAGMGPMKVVSTQCLTPKDAVPKNEDKNQNCEIKEQKMTGNKLTWKVVCSGKGEKTEGDGTITFKGDKYDGSVHMKMTDKKGRTMESTTIMTGKRIGDCTK